MDPLDHLLALPDGMRCTVCDEPVPAAGIRLLAWRDDLAFLELECRACLSTTLGFVVGGAADGPDEGGTRLEAGGAPEDAEPITSDDVLDMHQLLATWRGDLTGLLASDRRAGHPRDRRGRAHPSR